MMEIVINILLNIFFQIHILLNFPYLILYNSRQMQEGHSIAQAAYNEELFEPTYGRMLLAGERSGNLEDVLERLTGLLEENCGNGVDRLVGFVDPLLSGVLMVTVGLSLLSVMLPLIGMMNSVG